MVSHSFRTSCEPSGADAPSPTGPWSALLVPQIRLGPGPYQLRLPWPLEEREPRPILPRLRPAQFDPVLQSDVVNAFHQRFVLWIALFAPGEVAQIDARGEDHVDAWHRGDLL